MITNGVAIQQRVTAMENSLIAQIFAEQDASLRRFVHSLTHDKAETDDVMQDLYVKVLQRGQMVERSTSRTAYLFSVARNLVRDRARHRSASHRAMGNFKVVSELREACGAFSTSSPQEMRLRAEQGREAVDKAMGRLKDKHREIFCLSRMEGLCNREIAKRLGVSLRSVERHVSEVSLYMRETLSHCI